MKKQATKASSGKGIALKFKKRLSDTSSDHILSPTTPPSVSDASSAASISFVTAGVKRKREGIEAVQETLVALTKQVATLSEEFRQFRDELLMRQTTDLKADMIGIRDVVERLAGNCSNKEFNHLSDTLLNTLKQQYMKTFVDDKYPSETEIQKITRTWIAAAYPDSSTFKSKPKWTVWWTSNRSKLLGAFRNIRGNAVDRIKKALLQVFKSKLPPLPEKASLSDMAAWKQSDGVQWCLRHLNNLSSNEEGEETYLNNIVISAFGKEPRGGMGGTNIEFTYAVCRICLDPTYSGMDVSEEIVADIMNTMENEMSVDFEQAEVDTENLERDKESGEELSREYDEEGNTSD